MTGAPLTAAQLLAGPPATLSSTGLAVPSPSPTLGELDPNDVSPGLLGFAVIFGVVLLVHPALPLDDRQDPQGRAPAPSPRTAPGRSLRLGPGARRALMPAVRVAAVGLRSTLDTAANLDAAVRAVHAAADGGARLVVLPEYAAALDPRGVGPAQYEPPTGPFLAALAALAAERSVVVVAGTISAATGDERARTSCT